MANDNGWGDGVLNNTIGWGRGADNNTIGWGSVYGDSEAGLTALESAGGGTIPVISGVPTISAESQIGETITATAASATGDPTPTTSWTWQRSADGSTGWANIIGATSITYTLVAADDANYVRAVQTETNVLGSDSANSLASAQIAGVFSFGNALSFDGVNDNVSFTAVSKPALTNGLCFGFWLNFSSTPNFEYILGDSTNGNQWFRWNNSTSATFRSRSAGAATTTFSFPAISTSTWYYIAVSLNGGVNEMWINGTKYTGDTDNYDNENISFDLIGESSGAYGQFILDELFVKTESSLTQQNVDDLYNGGLGATATSVIASPNVYYKFNESGTDTTAVDASGNSNNGTLNNFPASGMWVSHPGGNYDAFVTTYYDQSGNSSNFIQASAAEQPMIVNAGVVVTSGGVPAVKFDGINEYLSNTVDLFGEARLDQFFLTDTDGDTAYIFPNSNITSYYGMIAYDGNTSTTTTSPSYGSPSLYQNGVPINVTNRTTVYNDTNGRKVISHIDAVTSIWAEYRFGFWSPGVLNFGGKLSALVAYASDQSANRVGIETILDSLYNP